MQKLFVLFLIISPQLSLAQRDQPDVIATNQGSLTIQPVTHGTVVLTWGGKTIYADPYGGAGLFEGLTAPDLILITDIHGDHLNVKTLEGLDLSKATFVVPQAVADQMPENMKKNVIVMGNGDIKQVTGIPIEAVPMYNLPEDATSRHTKGRGNGYVLNLGGKRVYLSGDTEDIPEMRALKNIDIAFVCMNQPFTMDIDQAASAVLAFKPKIVYPYHYRGSNGLSDVAAFKEKVGSDAGVEVRLKNWYPAN